MALLRVSQTGRRVIPKVETLLAPTAAPKDISATFQKRWGHIEKIGKPEQKQPIKFSTSDAYLNYKAVHNFYGDDRDLPNSHNIVISSSLTILLFYGFFIRDDPLDEGPEYFFRPLHETLPAVAIPLLEDAIKQHKRNGMDSKHLENRLAELMKNPHKYGGSAEKNLKDI